MRSSRVYLDHAASTPLRPEARVAVMDVLERVGNPESAHAEGRAVRDLLEEARSAAATALGVRPREVVFTASGTLASQIAMLGLAAAAKSRPGRIVLSAVEHPAIADAATRLEAQGHEVVRVPPEPDGRIAAARFLEAVGADTSVAALMLANHETGAVMPVAEVAGELGRRGVPLVCDACLGPDRLALRVRDLGADVTVLSAHKLGGPRGLGLLVIRRGTRLESVFSGGLQEERIHPGTVGVAAAAGAAAALRAALSDAADRAEAYARLADVFLGQLGDATAWRRIGPASGGLPGLVTLELPGVEGESVMIHMDIEGFAISTGSTCALGGTEPSASLLAMGLSRKRAASTIRISFGEGNSEADARHAADALARAAARLRGLAGRR